MTIERVGILMGLVVLGGVLWYWGAQPAKHRQVPLAELARFLSALMERGIPGAFMIVEFPGKPRRFLQYSKYAGSKPTGGLELAFPLAPWSEQYYNRVRDELERHGVPCRQERTGRTDTREFFNADFGSDVERTAVVSAALVESVFGLSPDSKITVWFKGVGPAK